MFFFTDANIFDSPHDVLVCPVNLKGVMGAGLAKSFADRVPGLLEGYQRVCATIHYSTGLPVFEIGKLWIYENWHKRVLCFPTKIHWMDNSDPIYIELGLQKFVSTYREKGIGSISFPMLGCGLGRLDWRKQVRPLFEKYLDGLDCEISVHGRLE